MAPDGEGGVDPGELREEVEAFLAGGGVAGVVEIHEEAIKLTDGEGGEDGVGGGGGFDLIAFAFEEEAKGFEDVGLIVGDEDAALLVGLVHWASGFLRSKLTSIVHGYGIISLGKGRVSDCGTGVRRRDGNFERRDNVLVCNDERFEPVGTVGDGCCDCPPADSISDDFLYCMRSRCDMAEGVARIRALVVGWCAVCGSAMGGPQWRHCRGRIRRRATRCATGRGRSGLVILQQ